MLEMMKMVGVSAALAAGIVAISEVQVHADQTAWGKIDSDRLFHEAVPARPAPGASLAGVQAGLNQQTATQKKGDSLRPAALTGCAAQAWPYIARQCLVSADGNSARARVRTVAVEQREGAHTPVLVRVPGPEFAQH
jgi:hypothetical protein